VAAPIRAPAHHPVIEKLHLPGLAGFGVATVASHGSSPEKVATQNATGQPEAREAIRNQHGCNTDLAGQLQSIAVVLHSRRWFSGALGPTIFWLQFRGRDTCRNFLPEAMK
jgi:hypothetical protein